MSDKYAKEPLEVRVSVRLTRSDVDALKDFAAERGQSVGDVIRHALQSPSTQGRSQVLAGDGEVQNLARVLAEYEDLFFKLYPKHDPRASRLQRAIRFVQSEQLARIERKRSARKFS